MAEDTLSAALRRQIIDRGCRYLEALEKALDPQERRGPETLRPRVSRSARPERPLGLDRRDG